MPWKKPKLHMKTFYEAIRMEGIHILVKTSSTWANLFMAQKGILLPLFLNLTSYQVMAMEAATYAHQKDFVMATATMERIN